MSTETYQAIKTAVQAHINEVHERLDKPPAVLLEVAIGYVVLHHEDTEVFTYDYIIDQTATPHSSVGLFAMAAGKLDLDMDPDSH